MHCRIASQTKRSVLPFSFQSLVPIVLFATPVLWWTAYSYQPVAVSSSCHVPPLQQRNKVTPPMSTVAWRQPLKRLCPRLHFHLPDLMSFCQLEWCSLQKAIRIVDIVWCNMFFFCFFKCCPLHVLVRPVDGADKGAMWWPIVGVFIMHMWDKLIIIVSTRACYVLAHISPRMIKLSKTMWKLKDINHDSQAVPI